MCTAMSPKEQNISKPVAASMAFAIFLVVDNLATPPQVMAGYLNGP